MNNSRLLGAMCVGISLLGPVHYANAVTVSTGDINADSGSDNVRVTLNLTQPSNIQPASLYIEFGGVSFSTVELDIDFNSTFIDRVEIDRPIWDFRDNGAWDVTGLLVDGDNFISFFGDPRDYVIGRVDITYSPVPIPPALYLFGSGLIGLVGVARRKAT